MSHVLAKNDIEFHIPNNLNAFEHVGTSKTMVSRKHTLQLQWFQCELCISMFTISVISIQPPKMFPHIKKNDAFT